MMDGPVPDFKDRHFNPERMTAKDADNEEKLLHIAWKVTVAWRRFGHWEYLFQDYVTEPHLAEYIRIATDRGGERITLSRMGKVKDLLDAPHPYRSGTQRLKELETTWTPKLETFVSATSPKDGNSKAPSRRGKPSSRSSTTSSRTR